MGKWIDRGVLFLLGTAALYLFFLNAWRSIPLACAATFVCDALLRRIVVRRPPRKQLTRRQAEAELQRISRLSDDEALAILGPLLKRRYPGEEYRLVPALKHPEASLSGGDILALWKANRDAARVAVAATCCCDPRAALYARELHDPQVAVMDRRQLARILRSCGDPASAIPPTEKPPRNGLRHLLCRVAAQPVRLRDALAAGLALILYLIGGSVLYLFCALAMLFRLGRGLIQSRGRARLFS